jgi:hypothetical protein
LPPAVTTMVNTIAVMPTSDGNDRSISPATMTNTSETARIIEIGTETKIAA